jgi:hypothetical protein
LSGIKGMLLNSCVLRLSLNDLRLPRQPAHLFQFANWLKEYTNLGNGNRIIFGLVDFGLHAPLPKIPRLRFHERLHLRDRPVIELVARLDQMATGVVLPFLDNEAGQATLCHQSRILSGMLRALIYHIHEILINLFTYRQAALLSADLTAGDTALDNSVLALALVDKSRQSLPSHQLRHAALALCSDLFYV